MVCWRSQEIILFRFFLAKGNLPPLQRRIKLHNFMAMLFVQSFNSQFWRTVETPIITKICWFYCSFIVYRLSALMGRKCPVVRSDIAHKFNLILYLSSGWMGFPCWGQLREVAPSSAFLEQDFVRCGDYAFVVVVVGDRRPVTGGWEGRSAEKDSPGQKRESRLTWQRLGQVDVIFRKQFAFSFRFVCHWTGFLLWSCRYGRASTVRSRERSFESAWEMCYRWYP